MSFNPVTALLYTSDFFLLSLNVYCLLCVVSQYQEYRAGRGTAEFCRRPLPVRYIPRPAATMTTCDTSRRNLSTSGLDLQSPSGFTSGIDPDRHSARKHVQFGDEASNDLLHAHWKETNHNATPNNKDGTCKTWLLPVDNRLPNLDTTPLICTPSPSPTSEKK